MSCSTSLAKMILFIFNIVFFLLGAASVGVGIWVAVNKSDLFRVINLIDARVDQGDNKGQIDSVANQNGLVMVAGFILIGIGAFTLVVGFCGCCGAVKESKCLLGMYAFLVGLVLAVEVAAAILAAVYQARIRTAAEDGMYGLQEKMFVAMTDYLSDSTSDNNKTVTTLINYLQMSFDCCGAKKPGDIANSSSWLLSNRSWEGRELQTPITCCQIRQDQKTAAAAPGYNWVSKLNGTLVDPSCPFTGTTQHTKTCYSGIMDFIGKFAGPLIGVCAGIAVFELFCIIVACCLVRAIEPKD
ncbi:hypothetical protein BOX15_Mlig023279g1 [Macrostomum lignano]|uniref:Tetraspanin n=1 Tax=Macrostomum lignano TaxID=282301 RepID=A0A267ERG2_9PLAT|nr:hypothetical protein BOX15_Mlig023279g1 [Macrostomum lignano]